MAGRVYVTPESSTAVPAAISRMPTTGARRCGRGKDDVGNAARAEFAGTDKLENALGEEHDARHNTDEKERDVPAHARPPRAVMHALAC
jgi:hypothetical protein